MDYKELNRDFTEGTSRIPIPIKSPVKFLKPEVVQEFRRAHSNYAGKSTDQQPTTSEPKATDSGEIISLLVHIPIKLLDPQFVKDLRKAREDNLNIKNYYSSFNPTQNSSETTSTATEQMDFDIGLKNYVIPKKQSAQDYYKSNISDQKKLRSLLTAPHQRQVPLGHAEKIGNQQKKSDIQTEPQKISTTIASKGSKKWIQPGYSIKLKNNYSDPSMNLSQTSTQKTEDFKTKSKRNFDSYSEPSTSKAGSSEIITINDQEDDVNNQKKIKKTDSSKPSWQNARKSVIQWFGIHPQEENKPLDVEIANQLNINQQIKELNLINFDGQPEEVDNQRKIFDQVERMLQKLTEDSD